MAKQGRLRLNQLADSVLEFIRNQVSTGIDNHTHNVDDLNGADTLVKRDSFNSAINEVNGKINDVENDISGINKKMENKSDKDHTHKISEIEGDDGEDLSIILNNTVKGYLFIDEKSSTNLTNCSVVEPNDGNTISTIVQSQAQGDFSVKYHIDRDRLCLGRNAIKLRMMSSVSNDEKVKIKITSISSTDLNTERRELGVIYEKQISLSQIHENYIDIYDVVELKLLAANSVGIEITIQQENKVAEAVINIDHMVIMPAFPGIFLS